MSATSTMAAPSLPKALDSDIDHLYCCDENVSLCRLDISDLPITDIENLCVVCADLEYVECPECGE